jgi:competence protein ComEA
MRLLLRLTVVAVFCGFGWTVAPAQPKWMKRPIIVIARNGNLIDINTATAAQLRSLPGMGSAYVARIVAGRPYTAKNQLVTRGVLPQAVYDKVQLRIIARKITK